MLTSFRRQTKARFDAFVTTFDFGGDVLPNHGSMFEAVARTAANQPDVIKLRMKIDQEVAVRSVFVLTDTRFRYRRVFQCGQTPGETLAHLGEPLAGHNSIARIRIKFGSMTIDRDLEDRKSVV